MLREGGGGIAPPYEPCILNTFIFSPQAFAAAEPFIRRFGLKPEPVASPSLFPAALPASCPAVAPTAIPNAGLPVTAVVAEPIVPETTAGNTL